MRMLVEAWLARAAAVTPDVVALEGPAGACSYSELHARACAGALELTRRGAVPGSRIAIALPPGLDFAVALHACLLLGAAAVPVDLRLGAAERAAIEHGATVVVGEPLGGADAAESLGGADTAGRLPAAGAAGSPAVHDLDAVAVVIHTSGTTSAPRPVELTYGNILWSALGSAVALGLDPAERWLCALPLSHVGGLSILLRSAIYGTTAVVHPRFETDTVLRALHEQRVTLVSLVATTLARLLDAGLREPPFLRCALTGGGPVPGALLDRARAAGVPVSLTYGLTEACSQVTTMPVALLGEPGSATPNAGPPSSLNAGPPLTPDAGPSPSLNAGPPLFCTRLRIAADGELEVAGPTVARAALGPDGWLHTGDLGRLSVEGCLEVTGRKADTIVSGGENVAPAEVEAVLEGHPAVLEAAVLGRPDERWGEAVTALVVVRAGAALDEQQLRAHCAARLAPYKVPKHIALVAGPLPRTRSGKLLRRELR
jgi:O-succinylbenzoic acid--CoA ligase